MRAAATVSAQWTMGGRVAAYTKGLSRAWRGRSTGYQVQHDRELRDRGDQAPEPQGHRVTSNCEGLVCESMMPFSMIAWFRGSLERVSNGTRINDGPI